MQTDNGVLAKLPGDVVSQAIKMCPDPVTATQYIQRVVVMAPIGPVEITCVRMRQPRWRQYYWTATRADPAR
jgi:hypothetical protein